jgi:hypothetical protein
MIPLCLIFTVCSLGMASTAESSVCFYHEVIEIDEESKKFGRFQLHPIWLINVCHFTVLNSLLLVWTILVCIVSVGSIQVFKQ